MGLKREQLCKMTPKNLCCDGNVLELDCTDLYHAINLFKKKNPNSILTIDEHYDICNCTIRVLLIKKKKEKKKEQNQELLV